MQVSEKTDQLFEEVVQELDKGVTEKGHPFRTFVLGTTGLEKIARQRTVVLRGLTKDLEICFYTDYRSKKVVHIKENNKVGLLFYHPEKRLQIKLEGLARIVSNTSEVLERWNTMSKTAKKDYTTTKAPGSELGDSEPLEFLSERNYFCEVQIKPFKIEYLKLQAPQHLRIRFSSSHGLWNGEFLVP
ncbi:pyridoxamine 5'-phosphate oxidase family protein [Eudoraea chungangensis]|uniref:pyridoxamine 5'-phosphate oxidase family protein n=1 Tax=Eudoraea chungangensis TaxID=1481905 RepID=UPI0023ED4F8B|nr:pyridoxamine 5'-phosphate oxidase family protein [Eudoraea chungangensis]